MGPRESVVSELRVPFRDSGFGIRDE